MAAKFESYKDKAGKFRWRLNPGNAKNGIESVHKNAPGASVDAQT